MNIIVQVIIILLLNILILLQIIIIIANELQLFILQKKLHEYTGVNNNTNNITV